MSTQSTSIGFILPAFAKINLILRVLDKRADGYHSLFTVFQAIDLHDLITFRFLPSSSFEVDLALDEPRIPQDQSNLIHRALTAVAEVHPINALVQVRVKKNIPVESGLGGGSSNAATALVAAARYLDWIPNRAELQRIAGRLGADVPFFLNGGTAAGRGKGDEIEPLPDALPYEVLLVHPHVSCSTAAIYRKYDELTSLTDPANSINMFRDQQPESQRDFVPSIENDLEKVVFTLHPELGSIKKKLLGSGAVTAALSGSGSSLFAFFRDGDDLERAARDFPVTTRTRLVSRMEYANRLGLPQGW